MAKKKKVAGSGRGNRRASVSGPPLDRIKEGGFVFHVYPHGTEVHRGRRCLGWILGMKEASGRHCFRLGCDSRRQPRTYRGRVKAAQALQVIDDLHREFTARKWTPQELIIRAWDDKPEASPRLE